MIRECKNASIGYNANKKLILLAIMPDYYLGLPMHSIS